LELGNPFRDRDDVLEVDDAPLPLVVEVWSRSTGGDDVEEKLADDQRRGDAEIWRLHPFEKTLTRWVRRRTAATRKRSIMVGSSAWRCSPTSRSTWTPSSRTEGTTVR
jgi:hypothetical protein